MMAAIPLAELNVVGEKYRWIWTSDEDPTAAEIRDIAAFCREQAEHAGAGTYATMLLAEAADLDALVDRIERGDA